MKTIIFLLAFIPLAAVHAQKPTTMQKDRQVLFDFRVSDESTPAKIAPATQRMVLSKVFRRYLTDANRCKSNGELGEDYLGAARKAGQIVPSISDVETGSFTAPGQMQTLYVIDVAECNASHADNFGTKRVAIFSGQQLVADVDADFAVSILKKTDLNGDGVDELLMITSYMGQGTLTEMATLGLPIHITELDVNSAAGGQRGFGADIANNAATTQGGLVSDAEKKLTDAYAGIFRAFLKHRDSVKLVTFWGANDANSWRANGKPLLFDVNSQPKPAFTAVIAEAKEASAVK